MIVIAIIAVLAIIMPKMGASRDKAKKAACMTNLHSIGVALELYANNHNGQFGPSGVTVPTDSNCYLVTSGYIKPQRCPIGSNYLIWSVAGAVFTEYRPAARW